jgi:uncharacterized membrane protein
VWGLTSGTCSFVLQAEKEVRALEKSLEKLGLKNTEYARSFKKVDNKQGYEERAALRQKLDRAYDRLKFKRNEEKNVAGDIEVRPRVGIDSAIVDCTYGKNIHIRASIR